MNTLSKRDCRTAKAENRLLKALQIKDNEEICFPIKWMRLNGGDISAATLDNECRNLGV